MENDRPITPNPTRRPFRSFLKGLVAFFVVLAALIIIKDEVVYRAYMGEPEGDMGGLFGEWTCNTFGVQLVGDLVTYPFSSEEYPSFTAADDVLMAIEEAEGDDAIKAVVLEIDSYGGSPVAADEIAQALKALSKPSVVYIRGAGLSAAYWSATGADTIFATKNSDVGSIGVTMSYIENAEQNEKNGLRYISISSGAYKDAGDPNRELTEAEREIFARDVMIIHQNFVSAVAENRGLERSVVEKIADGSSMLGEAAKEAGLVDEVGTFLDVKDYLSGILGEEPDICWHQSVFDGEESESI